MADHTVKGNRLFVAMLAVLVWVGIYGCSTSSGPNWYIAGKVKTKAGTGLAGATVTATCKSSSTTAINYSDTTPASGDYHLDIPWNRDLCTVLIAKKSGFIPYRYSNVAKPGGGVPLIKNFTLVLVQ